MLPDLSRPSVFGYGLVARGALEFLPGAQVYDDACTAAREVENGAVLRPSAEFRPELSSMELISPGLAPVHPLVRAALHPISELDFFAPALGRQIWLSGTNGKTTTTALSAHLLSAPAVGNIGRSLKDAISAPLACVEASSFALHYTRTAAPEIYALLDITPDHLSWHGDFAAYLAAKLSPLERMSEGALAILPAWLSGRFRTRARVVFYSHEADLARYFGFDLARIYAHFTGILALDAALAASIAVAVNGDFSDELMASFQVAAHRCAMFERGGLCFCDDSKATNIDAARQCVKGLLRAGFKRVHLLVGGDAKGQDLASFCASLPQEVQLYGIGAQDISHMLRGGQWGSMRESLARAVAAAADGDIIALSPACASLDQYSGYAQRGEEFVRLASELAGV